jgi:hypothetical protein
MLNAVTAGRVPDRRRALVRSDPERRVAPTVHPILQLQRLAGNVAVQRGLKLDGSLAHVDALLALLNPASGLALSRDRASKLVTAAGAAVKAKSPALAARLQAILADKSRVAMLRVDDKGQGIWFGKFPDSPDKPVQELRIDQLLALEKGVPGAGVATLAHEIIENYEAQARLTDDWSDVKHETHKGALTEEDTILGELQDALGQPRSGTRRLTFTAVLPGSGHTPAERARTERNLKIETHDNDFVVYELGELGTGTIKKVLRAAADPLGSWRVPGFTAASAAIPKGSEATMQKVADLLSKDPTACVMLRPTADANAAPKTFDWCLQVERAIQQRMLDDPIRRSGERFSILPTTVAPTNAIDLTVRRPKLP